MTSNRCVGSDTRPWEGPGARWLLMQPRADDVGPRWACRVNRQAIADTMRVDDRSVRSSRAVLTRSLAPQPCRKGRTPRHPNEARGWTTERGAFAVQVLKVRLAAAQRRDVSGTHTGSVRAHVWMNAQCLLAAPRPHGTYVCRWQRIPSHAPVWRRRARGMRRSEGAWLWGTYD